MNSTVNFFLSITPPWILFSLPYVPSLFTSWRTKRCLHVYYMNSTAWSRHEREIVFPLSHNAVIATSNAAFLIALYKRCKLLMNNIACGKDPGGEGGGCLFFAWQRATFTVLRCISLPLRTSVS